MPTINDVAKACGLSAATVSYVINNGPRAVRPQTRARVLAAIRQLNYYPSAIARGLAGHRMNTLGVGLPHPIIAPLTNPYFAPILDGIVDAAMQRGQNTTLFTGHIWSDPEGGLPIFCDGRCDGLILIAPPLQSDIIPALSGRGLPLVLINDSGGDANVACVDVDSVAGMRALVRYLIEQGHRRIAMLCGGDYLRNAMERLQGYREALEAAGLPYDEALVFPGHCCEESGYENTALVLSRFIGAERPTALCCGNDAIAFGALRFLAEAGLRVPQDISLVGFDDLKGADLSDPPLTTVRQPLQQLGECAVEMLLAQIQEGAPPKKQILEPQYILRGSAAPPQGA